MPSYNKVILAGHTTRDPQMAYLPSQTAVVDFGLAVNRKWKDKDGSAKEEVCFVDIKAFGKSAETIQKYVKKGDAILIEGRLTFQQWEDKTGAKRSKHVVTVDSFQFLGGKGEPAKREKEAAADHNGELPPDSEYPF